MRLVAEEVFDVISENAFTASEYPLILVIRVRADQESQKLLAKMLQKIFKTKICRKSDSPDEPTPNNLKNKILFEISGRSNDDFSLELETAIVLIVIF